MNRSAALSILVLSVMLGGKIAFGQQTVVVNPEETDEILANPGMGWETFHQTSKQDKSLPSWIPSTIHYARWGWGELEPQPGKLNTEFFDKVLKETHESGQKLAFRVMCCSTTRNVPYHPKWLKELGGKELQADYEGQGVFPIPDMDDPVVLKAHLDFIKRLGEKYDGHADIEHVDLGSIGWWGEWHLSGSRTCKLPMLENRMKVVDAYLAAFKKTPLLMLIGGDECFRYACAHGTGWRADCLGDMGGFSKRWCHMLHAYPVEVRLVPEVWKTAPAAWETCWDMRKWVNEGWSLRYIFNYALACHASVINNKSAPLPQGANVRPELERFLRRLGYRLVLKELKHPAQVKAGGKLEVAMKWQNTGSAPCYKPYGVAYRLDNGKGHSMTYVGDVKANRWLPGSIDLFTADFFRMPKDLPPGEINAVADTIDLAPPSLPVGQYTLSVAMVETDIDPVVRLGIKGRDDDGWYPLSKVEVVSTHKLAGAGEQKDEATHQAKTSMKGWELYVWQEKGDTYFALMAGTNRLKTDAEITKAAVKGIDAIKPKLDELKRGENVFISGKALLTAAPKESSVQILEYCKTRGLKVQRHE